MPLLLALEVPELPELPAVELLVPEVLELELSVLLLPELPESPLAVVPDDPAELAALDEVPKPSVDPLVPLVLTVPPVVPRVPVSEPPGPAAGEPEQAIAPEIATQSQSSRRMSRLFEIEAQRG